MKNSTAVPSRRDLLAFAVFGFLLACHRGLAQGLTPADGALGLAGLYAVCRWWRSHPRLPLILPPWPFLIFLAALGISGLYAAFTTPDRAIIREELQALAALPAAWLICSVLIGRSRPRLTALISGIVAAAGLEALVASVRLFTAENRFTPGVLTPDRNGLAMLVMVCMPLALALAAGMQRKGAAAAAIAAAGLMVSTVFSAGALLAGLAGAVTLGLCLPDRRRLAAGGAAVLAGIVLLLLHPESTGMLKASIAPAVAENCLVKSRSDEYIARRDALHAAAPAWFVKPTAMRYRRWGWALQQAGSGIRPFLIGTGPGTYNTALKSFSRTDGKPAIDTDETMMFNIGVSEPGSFGAWWVQLVETGLLGAAALAACLIIPLIRALRTRHGDGPLKAGAAGSLAALLIIDLFHSHLTGGMFILVTVIVYAAVTDFDPGENHA